MNFYLLDILLMQCYRFINAEPKSVEITLKDQ